MVKNQWLEIAYKEFAENGPRGMSINKIAKDLGSSRSSFYHHFSELDILIDELLKMHYGICQEFNRKGKKHCKKMVPDLYQILSEFPIALKFSIQLFHNRHIPRFGLLFNKTFEESEEAFTLKLFAEQMNLDPSSNDVFRLYKTLGEAWYSRLNPNDLSAETLQSHAEEIMKDISHLTASNIYSVIG